MKEQKPLTMSLDGTKGIPFTVASALFRELGERLVGAPHIALAELVKNGYDADASQVVVRLQADRIEVADNGIGMNSDEFRDFWMRVGTVHKQEERLSPELKRPMTGSKGIGRLAVQFLANRIEIHTVSKKDPKTELQAYVNWEDAVSAGDLIEATALYKQVSSKIEFPEGKSHGTSITLSGLKQNWDADGVKDLAKQVWWLQPPFRTNPNVKTDAQKAFAVVLKSADRTVEQGFDAQMGAAQNNWYARIAGRLVPGKDASEGKKRWVELSVQFYDGEQIRQKYSIPSETHKVPYCRVDSVNFEIRVYYLWGKQRAGISVYDAKEHFLKFGGVHVFDAGFHLPYYGPNTDWLNIERDHSHRLNVSQLVPKALQKDVSRGLNFLPTQGRILGVVNVDTSGERQAAIRRKDGDRNDYLNISLSRDRLVDNGAFQDLVYIVRWALDFYAIREAFRKAKDEEAKRPTESLDYTLRRFEDVLEEHASEIPREVYKELQGGVRSTKEVAIEEEAVVKAQSALLAALATAGIAAVAYEHEVGKQFELIQEVIEALHKVQAVNPVVRHELNDIADKLSEWIERARATRALFSPLMDEQDRETEGRFKARALIEQVATQVAVITRGIPIDASEVDEDLRLPEGKFAEWSAIFQNVFINAINAMLDSSTKRILVSSRCRGRARAILVQDTGVGVDLESSEELFEPFVRRLKLSRERRQLGLGGTGLGLTIVRMIAQNRDCKVSFIEPDKGFRTAFSLSWSEGK